MGQNHTFICFPEFLCSDHPQLPEVNFEKYFLIFVLHLNNFQLFRQCAEAYHTQKHTIYKNSLNEYKIV